MRRGVACVMLLVSLTAVHAQQLTAEEAYRTGLSAKRLGDLALAYSRLREAVALNSADGEAWWVLAWVCAGTDRPQQAAEAFQKASELLDSDDPRVATAKAKAAKLATQAPTQLKPRRQANVPEPPPEHMRVPLFEGFPWGWAWFVFGLYLTAAAVAWWLDYLNDAGSPLGRYHRLCRAAARGRRRAVADLLRLAHGQALDELPRADLTTVITLAAHQDHGVRTMLADTVRRGVGGVQRAAAEALAAQPEQPDPALWPPLLGQPNRALCLAALEALRHGPTAAALEPLTRLATGADEELATRAVAALAALETEPGAAALARAAAYSSSHAARREALVSLARNQRVPGSALADLIEVLQQADDELRRLAATALAHGGRAAGRALLNATLDAAEPVRVAAAEAARQLLADGADLASELADWVAAQLAAPGAASPEALTVAAEGDAAGLLELLGRSLTQPAGEHDELRARAAALLAARGEPRATTILAGALASLPPHGTASEAEQALAADLCRALAGRHPDQALPALLERSALERDDPVPWSAATLTAALPGAGGGLARTLAHPSGKVRRLAIRLLASHPAPEAADGLVAELLATTADSASWDVVEHLARALAALGEQRAVEPLARLREQSPGVACDALDVSLARLGEPGARQRVEEMLQRETWAARRPAADYFRHFQQPPARAQAVVAEALAHEQAMALTQAAEPTEAALVALGGSVKPTLHEWLQTDRHRPLAAAALAQLGEPEAGPLAEQMDRVDQLAADPNQHCDELAEVARSANDRLRHYLARRLGTELLQELLDETEETKGGGRSAAPRE